LLSFSYLVLPQSFQQRRFSTITIGTTIITIATIGKR
jgi:hypothetical protein